MTRMLPRPLDPLRSFKLKVSLVVGIVLVLASVVFWIGAGWQFRYTLLAALVVSLAATQFVAHGMTSPLREMTSAAKAMARGDYSTRVRATSRDEVGELATAFNTMASDLEAAEKYRRELIGNVSLRVLPTERPDAWEVQGRGELALAILVEQMRREGFELTVGKPQVVTREIDGKLHEPTERLTIDTPEEHLGGITQLLAARKGRMEQMTNHGTGWIRMEFVVPARGLIGFRTEFLTETRGTGIAHSIHEGYEPWFGVITTRVAGSLVADRSGPVTSYAMVNLQERGVLFVSPGTEVYEGMIVGENSRADDMDVNITKEKKLTNVRASSADNFEKVIPPKQLSLEQSLEFCREDECCEVTPTAVCIRKVVLNAGERARTASRVRTANKR